MMRNTKDDFDHPLFSNRTLKVLSDSYRPYKLCSFEIYAPLQQDLWQKSDFA